MSDDQRDRRVTKQNEAEEFERIVKKYGRNITVPKRPKT